MFQQHSLCNYNNPPHFDPISTMNRHCNDEVLNSDDKKIHQYHQNESITSHLKHKNPTKYVGLVQSGRHLHHLIEH